MQCPLRANISIDASLSDANQQFDFVFDKKKSLCPDFRNFVGDNYHCIRIVFVLSNQHYFNFIRYVFNFKYTRLIAK